ADAELPHRLAARAADVRCETRQRRGRHRLLHGLDRSAILRRDGLVRRRRGRVFRLLARRGQQHERERERTHALTMSRVDALVMYDAPMLRAGLIAATFCALGCPSRGPEPVRSPVVDVATRVRIAGDEANGNEPDLATLADPPYDVPTRVLALRGLGRID